MKRNLLPRLAPAALGLLLAPAAAGQPRAHNFSLDRVNRVRATPTVVLAPPAAGAARGPGPAAGESVAVQGHVAGPDGRGVAGAAVALVGTALATSTDAAGDFALAVPAAVLGALPDAPVRLRLTYPGFAARAVELAPRPADLAGAVAVQVLAGPADVQVTRTRTLTMVAARIEHLEMATRPQEPSFDWPPPAPSARCVLPAAFMAGVQRLSGADARLSAALDRAGFGTPSYFHIPNGFALAAHIEGLDAQDNPLPGAGRWAVDGAPGKSLADFLRNLVVARVGRFRVLVFAVTSSPFAPSAETISKAAAMDWFTEGLNKLPAAVGNLPWTPDYACTALVYEFEKTETAPVAQVPQSPYPGYQHLVKAGVLVPPAPRWAKSW